MDHLQKVRFISNTGRSWLDKLWSEIESERFVASTNWAIDLTPSDLYGVIWHIGNFTARAYFSFSATSFLEKKEFSEQKAFYRKVLFPDDPELCFGGDEQEALLCLKDVALGAMTHFQVGGHQYPLRETADAPSSFMENL